MTVREYFEQIDPHYDVTFIKARARKDARSPYFHPEYQTTPIWRVSDWLDPRYDNKKLLDSIILNDKQPPITWLCGVNWTNRIEIGSLKCLLVVSQEDFEELYPGKDQRKSMEQYIDKHMDMN